MRRAIATGVSFFLMACSDPAASDPPPTTIAAPPPPTEAPPPPEPEPLYESAELPPPTVVAPPTTVAPTGAGIVVSPHPIVLDGITGTLDHDPVDGRATIVATPSGEVRIAEVHALPGDVMDGAHMQAQLERIGARFTTSESAADRWALAYDLDGHLSVQCGLVVDGHTYVCRGQYPDAAAQAQASPCAARCVAPAAQRSRPRAA